MLNGIYRHSVDAKGRMAVPVKFRAELGDSFFLTVGLDSCLYIFSQTEWEKFNTAIRSTLSFTAAEKLSRFFNAYSFEVEPDLPGQGNHPHRTSQSRRNRQTGGCYRCIQSRRNMGARKVGRGSEGHYRRGYTRAA